MAKKKKEISRTKKPKEVKSEPETKDESKPFDFGGLPNSNLKKNLGCG